MQVFWSYDENVSDNDCFVFLSANPDIVSFPSDADCDSHNCGFSGGFFRILMTSDYTAGTQITIDAFNYMEYSNPDGVLLSWEYRVDCDSD